MDQYQHDRTKLLLDSRYYLSPLEHRDRDDIYEAMNNKEMTKYLAVPHVDPYTVENADEFIDYATRDWIGNDTPKVWAIRDAQVTDKMVGVIDIRLSTKANLYMVDALHMKAGKPPFASFGFWLIPDYWGAGVMPKALNSMVEAIGIKKLGLAHFDGTSVAGHWASRKVFQKCGFTFMGEEERVYKVKGVEKSNATWVYKRTIPDA